MEIRKTFEILLWENDHAGENRNSLYFLTMMTGAVSAAPVLNYTGEERLEEERQERLRMPRVENMGSSLNEKEETQGAALEPVFRINEIILSGQGEKFGRLHKIIYSKNSAVIPWKNAFPIKEGDILNIRHLEQGWNR